MEMSLKDATHSQVNSDTQVKDREIEMLKQDVRERDRENKMFFVKLHFLIGFTIVLAGRKN